MLVSVDPASLVRAVETEGGDRYIEILTGGRHHHVVCPHHEARWRVEGGAGGVLETFPWLEERLLADHAGTVHVLGATSRVGNLPGAPKQLHRLRPLVFNLH